jgi:hypothetical protein
MRAMPLTTSAAPKAPAQQPKPVPVNTPASKLSGYLLTYASFITASVIAFVVAWENTNQPFKAAASMFHPSDPLSVAPIGGLALGIIAIVMFLITFEVVSVIAVSIVCRLALYAQPRRRLSTIIWLDLIIILVPIVAYLGKSIILGLVLLIAAPLLARFIATRGQASTV